MTEFVRFVVLGLGAGAIYAVLGQGVSLVFRGSGVLNFAQGAIAVLGAFIYWTLRFEHSWAFVPAVLVAALVGALIGVLVQLLVMRGLRNAAQLNKVIATLGVLVAIQGSAVLMWDVEPRMVTSALPRTAWEVGGILILADRLWLLVIAVLLTVALWLAYRYTSFGLATRASAENSSAAAALGWSPNLIAAANWALGGALAAVAGVLIAPIAGLSVLLMTTLTVAALAASLIGGFSSFPLTLAGGLFLGIAESLLGRYSSQPGVAETFPLVVIILLLVVRGRTLPLRSHIAERLPAVGGGGVHPLRTSVLFTISALLLGVWLPEELVIATTISIVFALFMLSVLVVTGYAGQLSLAQVMIGGVGAYIAARLVALAGWPFELAILAGILGAVLVGLLFGLPAIRARGAQLAVVTLGLAFGIQKMLFHNQEYTGGLAGTVIGSPKIFGIDLDAIVHPRRYAVATLIGFTLCAVAVATMRTSRVGRRLLAVRTNERAASALGISVVGAKLYAFALSSGIAAVAGVLLAFRTPTVDFATTFDPFQSILIVAFAVIGGIGFIAGVLLAGLFFVADGLVAVIFMHFIENLNQYLAPIAGVILLVNVVRTPNGLQEELSHQIAPLRRLGRRLVGRVRHPVEESEEQAPIEVSRVAPAALAIRDVTVRFGAVRAVDGATLEMCTGEVVGLIGPNGAGKTTVIDAITGYATALGDITLNGKSILSLAPHLRARSGISRSFQSLELFEDMTVRDNLRAASDSSDLAGYLSTLVRTGSREMAPFARAAISELGLESDLDRRPGELPYSRRRLVAIARAVASGPSILLLDEPAAGLGDVERDELCHLIRRLVDNWGMGVLLIEHDVDLVMRVCDRVVALEFGKVIASGSPEEIRKDPFVIESYLGVSSSEREPAEACEIGAER